MTESTQRRAYDQQFSEQKPVSTKQFFAYVKDKLKHHKLSNAEKV